jgi:hypothetical protein
MPWYDEWEGRFMNLDIWFCSINSFLDKVEPNEWCSGAFPYGKYADIWTKRNDEWLELLKDTGCIQKSK